MVGIYGPPGAYKSLLISEVAVAGVTGGTWLGRPVCKGAVLIIAPERPDLHRDRIERMVPAGAAIAVCEPEELDLRSSKALADIKSMVATVAHRFGTTISMIVIDTLAASLPGADENSSRDMGEAMRTLSRIARTTGATVVFIHHTGKVDKRGLRGSNATLAAADVVLRIGEDKVSPFIEVEKINCQKRPTDRFRFAVKDIETSSGVTTPRIHFEIDAKSVGKPTAAAKRCLQALESLGVGSSLADWRLRFVEMFPGKYTRQEWASHKDLLALRLVVEKSGLYCVGGVGNA
jgi:hypothetical protein